MARDEESEGGDPGVYGDEGREELMEAGEISAEEDAFMQGYDHADSDEEDTASDAYEAAFEGRKEKKRKSRREDLDDEDEF